MPTMTSVKVNDSGVGFLKKLRTNRRKIEIDEEDLSYSKLIGVITKYFKMNNDEYHKLIKLEADKNV